LHGSTPSAVDPDTLQARILVPRDERRFVVQEWLDEDTLLLLDMDDQPGRWMPCPASSSSSMASHRAPYLKTITDDDDAPHRFKVLL
jgi:hypothetical protein